MIAMMMTRMEAWVGGNSNVGAGARWIVGWRLHWDVGASSVSPQLAHRGGGSHTMGVTHLALTGDRQTHLESLSQKKFMGIWKPDFYREKGSKDI